PRGARETQDPAKPSTLQRACDGARPLLARLAPLPAPSQRTLSGGNDCPDETHRTVTHTEVYAAISLVGGHRQPQVHLQVAHLDSGTLSLELPGRSDPARGRSFAHAPDPWRAGLRRTARPCASPAGS